MNTALRTFIAAILMGLGIISTVWGTRTLWRTSNTFRDVLYALGDFFATYGEYIAGTIFAVGILWLMCFGLDAWIKHIKNSRACKAAGGKLIISCWSTAPHGRKIWDESERPYK